MTRQKVLTLSVVLLFLALFSHAAEAPVIQWPLELEGPGGKIAIYEPQPETFQGDKLTARAAVAVLLKGKKEPVFGAAWFNARVATDRAARTVTLLELTVSRSK